MKFSSKPRRPALLATVMLGAGFASAHAADISGTTVAFLMPDQGSTRYEQHDLPGFEAEMRKLCPSCKVLYQNANGDASQQQQQFNSVIAQGAKVIVLDPVDSTAAASLVKIAQSQGIKVIAYDRPIPDGGRLLRLVRQRRRSARRSPQSLVQHLKEKACRPTRAAACRSTARRPTRPPA